MLSQDELGDKLTNALHIEKLDDVYLLSQLLVGTLMSLEPLGAPFDAISLFEATAAPGD